MKPLQRVVNGARGSRPQSALKRDILRKKKKKSEDGFELQAVERALDVQKGPVFTENKEGEVRMVLSGDRISVWHQEPSSGWRPHSEHRSSLLLGFLQPWQLPMGREEGVISYFGVYRVSAVGHWDKDAYGLKRAYRKESTTELAP